jgi:hypothetical protein
MHMALLAPLHHAWLHMALALQSMQQERKVCSCHAYVLLHLLLYISRAGTLLSGMLWCQPDSMRHAS